MVLATTNDTTRAVVTGIGACAPNGLGLEQYWAATIAGRTGIGPLTRFDRAPYRAGLAGEVADFEPRDHLPGKLMPQTDRMTQLSLAAADWALADAGVDPAVLPSYGMSVVTAATAGGYEFGQRELQKLWSQGPDFVSAYQSFAWFYAVNTGQISIRNGMRGPGAVLVSEQAGGLDAVGHARRQIRAGSRLVVTGGVDSSLCPWAWVAHQVSGRLSFRTNPESAYLPFDADANGYVVGEGGALFVIEPLDDARERAATVYGEVAGYAATFDARPPQPARGLRRAAEQAIADAGLAPGDIDVVFADAAGIAAEDRVEAEAITAVFGPYGVPVTAPKSMTGRLFAGGSSLDMAAALLSIRDGILPPTVNVHTLVPDYTIDLVRGAPRRGGRIDTALVLARGRGGFNSAAVLRRV